MPGAGLSRRSPRKAPFGKPAFQPYWGKLTVRNDRGDRGNVGIIRSPIRASILPDLGQIDAATRKDDATFQQYLPGLLDLLAKHPLAINAGVAKLLTRYRTCRTVTIHPGLRDFTVAQWGNPWLSLNRAKWSLVGDDARAMVADWLKLVLIQQFFSLLAADGTNDTRRLKFWERYHDSIDDMYFALGDTARWHRGADFQDIRKKMAGRLLNLHSAGPPNNNAFIMCIGNFVVVEFGITGNACYIFRRDQLPLGLD